MDGPRACRGWGHPSAEVAVRTMKPIVLFLVAAFAVTVVNLAAGARIAGVRDLQSVLSMLK